NICLKEDFTAIKSQFAPKKCYFFSPLGRFLYLRLDGNMRTVPYFCPLHVSLRTDFMYKTGSRGKNLINGLVLGINRHNTIQRVTNERLGKIIQKNWSKSAIMPKKCLI
ncbi:hypothetical protein, partial [Carboxydothermus pertinax]